MYKVTAPYLQLYFISALIPLDVYLKGTLVCLTTSLVQLVSNANIALWGNSVYAL